MSFASSPTSFPKSYQINWQKQLTSSCLATKHPCKPSSSLFLPLLKMLSAKPSQLPLCHCNLINSFAPRPWTTAPAHNCGLGYSYNLFYFYFISSLPPLCLYLLFPAFSYTTSRVEKICCSHIEEYSFCKMRYLKGLEGFFLISIFREFLVLLFFFPNRS